MGGPCTDNKCTKGPLDLTMEICCGDGKTFGKDFGDMVPDDWQPNSVWKAKYDSDTYDETEVSWTDPSTYTWVQYVVILLAVIGLCSLCMCPYIYWKKRTKKGTVSFKINDIADCDGATTALTPQGRSATGTTGVATPRKKGFRSKFGKNKTHGKL